MRCVRIFWPRVVWYILSVSSVGFNLGVCASVHRCCAVQDRMANREEGNQTEEAHTQVETVLTQMTEFMTGLREFKEADTARSRPLRGSRCPGQACKCVSTLNGTE